MTTSPVMSITDELVAELERAKQDDAGRIYCDGNVWMGHGPAARCGSIWGSIIQCSKCKELESKRAMIEEIKSLAAEREQLKRDAERYRWLQKASPYMHKKIRDSAITDGGDVFYFHRERYDAAIDAAMKS